MMGEYLPDKPEELQSASRSHKPEFLAALRQTQQKKLDEAFLKFRQQVSINSSFVNQLHQTINNFIAATTKAHKDWEQKLSNLPSNASEVLKNFMLERKASIEGLQNELYAMQQTALEQAESSIIELRKTITSLSYPVPVDANGPVREQCIRTNIHHIINGSFVQQILNDIISQEFYLLKLYTNEINNNKTKG